MFKKDLVKKFKILYKDDHNRILLLKLWLKDNNILNIASIYSIPNQTTIQTQEFYNRLRIMILRNEKENLLIAGDFNAVEYIKKDIHITSKN